MSFTSEGKLKLSQKELTSLLSGRRFDENFKEVAKLIFVAGMDSAAVAKKMELTRGRIYQIRDKVHALYLENSQYPVGWQRVTLVAPPELLKEFNDRIEGELRRIREGRT